MFQVLTIKRSAFTFVAIDKHRKPRKIHQKWKKNRRIILLLILIKLFVMICLIFSSVKTCARFMRTFAGNIRSKQTGPYG